ncbi:DUF192 domain-containing protein [Halostella pelagica]|uniref:DUF192 domain-containing protein n=1 Tax=Halostella pelagica TaxID=2583824 RepID=UPI0010818D88|nr:DUF192 domain-containing protein [Halostella pelagica]
MERRQILNVAGVLVVVALLGGFAVQAGFVENPFAEDRDQATVTVRDGGNETTENGGENGRDGDDEVLAVVDAEVADTQSERITGLSEHDSLDNGSGMLFVYDDEQDLTYVMREMDFGLDIIFIGENRTITSIHDAPKPGPNEDGEEQKYSGRGKWVLEVPRGYTDANDIDEGDTIEIEYGNGTANQSENATVNVSQNTTSTTGESLELAEREAVRRS